LKHSFSWLLRFAASIERRQEPAAVLNLNEEGKMRLEDKVAIVTGAAHGMGEAEARLFAQEGAKVVVADVLGEQAEAVAADIRAGGGEAIAATKSCADPQSGTWSPSVSIPQDLATGT
jgi:hypothetical protein